MNLDADIAIPVEGGALAGTLEIPVDARGIVLFAHGSGSTHNSPRNRRVAASLQNAGFGTLLFDLLTEPEADDDEFTRAFRFDTPLLASRLIRATDWLCDQRERGDLDIGFFGASTGAAASLVAAAALGPQVGAVVSRGGRPDLAGPALGQVMSPTLLIVGGLDEPVLGLNRQALAELRCEKELAIVPGATHLFEEAGTLDVVIDMAATWFDRYLGMAR